MTITVDRRLFGDAVRKAMAALPKHGNLPVLNGLHINPVSDSVIEVTG